MRPTVIFAILGCILAVSAVLFQINQHFNKYENAIRDSIYDRAAKEIQNKDIEKLSEQIEIIRKQNEAVLKIREETANQLAENEAAIERSLSQFRTKLNQAPDDQALAVALDDSREIYPERPE